MSKALLKEVCRTCLARGNTLFALDKSQVQDTAGNAESNSGKTFGEMLMECANVQINSDDGLPQSVCLQCICAIRSAVAFKGMCEESDVTLREISTQLAAIEQSKSSKIGETKQRADDLSADPLDVDPQWFDEWTSHAIVNELSGNDDNFSMFDIDSDTNEVNFDETGLSDADDMNATSGSIQQSKPCDTQLEADGSILVTAKNVNRLWPCEVCQKAFTDRKSLNSHVRVHSLTKSHGSPASVEGNLSYEENSKPKRRVSARRIGKCEPKDPLEIAAAIEESVSQNFKCHQCGVHFESFGSLVLHTDVIHQRFECDVCGKQLATNRNLERHKQTHSNKQPEIGSTTAMRKKLCATKKFTCDLCQRLFTFKGNLKAHMQTHFPSATANNGTLCMHCGKIVKGKNMMVHMRRHTGERPYKCDICGKGFITPAYMADHRRVHTGEKTFSCEHCGRGFNRATRYAEHMRIHGLPLYAENRPYSCEGCDRRFSHVKFKNRHICDGHKPHLMER